MVVQFSSLVCFYSVLLPFNCTIENRIKVEGLRANATMAGRRKDFKTINHV